MTLGWSEHPEATEELLAAIRYYHLQRPGLGDNFDAWIIAAIQDICEWPYSGPPFPGWSRRPIVRTRRVGIFPYRVVYFVRENEVVIVAYAHTHREAGYWRRRLSD